MSGTPDADAETLAFYAREAQAYAGRPCADALRWMEDFIALTPRRMGGRRRVLELGCGDGRDANALAQRGFEVTASDASPELAEIARARHGLNVRVMRFEELDDVETFEGVVAHASLLHAPLAALPGIFARIARALTPGGCFYASFKTGEGEARDRLGRFNAYQSEASLTALYDEALWLPPAIATRRDKGYDGVETGWLLAYAIRR